jgi:hypothetical protein
VADDVSRSAAKLATLVAVPLALAAGVVAFVLLSNVFGAGAADPGSPEPAPVTTEPVPLEARDLPEREETVCRALLSQIPESVRDLPQRPVTAGAEQNAAYGNPPITVECGVPAADYALTDTVWPLDGVCWHATERPDATRWVTVDREVPVRVTVPDTYEGPGQWVAEFSDTIVATVLSADESDIPSGCR